jgi:hypothetical protein
MLDLEAILLKVGILEAALHLVVLGVYDGLLLGRPVHLKVVQDFVITASLVLDVRGCLGR